MLKDGDLKKSKGGLNVHFTADLYHWKGYFKHFPLVITDLEKKCKKRDCKANRRFALQNMQLRKIPSPT